MAMGGSTQALSTVGGGLLLIVSKKIRTFPKNPSPQEMVSHIIYSSLFFLYGISQKKSALLKTHIFCVKWSVGNMG